MLNEKEKDNPKKKEFKLKNKNKNYDFAKSTLTHNPIVDPQNNLEYNKYLKFSESQRNISNRGNYQLNNNSNMQSQSNNILNPNNYSNIPQIIAKSPQNSFFSGEILNNQSMKKFI